MKTSFTLLLFLTLAASAGSGAPQSQSEADKNPPQSGAGAVPRPDAGKPRSGAGPKGSISGRVVGESGQGLMLASVNVSAVGGGSAKTLNLSASTDEDGRFELANLPARAFSVRVYAPGYVRSSRDDTDFHRPGDSLTIRMIKGGVITGTVTNSVGNAVVGLPVVAIHIRDSEGKSSRSTGVGARDRRTDDHGVYRIYSLEPGSYLVMAGGVQRSFPATPFDRDVPTYFPSSTRDTATEVSVSSGEETSGIDIRYRGEPGHAISGSVSGMIGTASSFYGASILLYRAGAEYPEATTGVSLATANRGFAFYGIADGEYELMAQRVFGGEGMASGVRRVSVKGADVSGVDLSLAPLGRISGRVALEPLPSDPPADCKKPQAIRQQEIVIAVRRYERKSASPSHLASRGYAAPDDKGSFSISNLGPGEYQFETRLPGNGWYVKSVTSLSAQPAPPPRGAPAGAQAMANPVTIRAGERVDGLTITFAEGAAALSGRLDITEGVNYSSARIQLIPVEQEFANEPLRYAESLIGTGGSFSFSGIAPGRYWLFGAMVDDSASPEGERFPSSWNPLIRKAMRKAVETAGQIVELKPCQRITDLVHRTVDSSNRNERSRRYD
jgi:hypothetical protein